MPEKGKVSGNSGGVAILTRRFFGRNTNLTISLRITETEKLNQAKQVIGGTGNMLFSTVSQNLKMGHIQGFLSVNL